MNNKTNSKLIMPLLLVVAAFVLLIGGVIAYGEYGGDGSETTRAPEQSTAVQADKETTETKAEDTITYTATNEGTALEQLMAINDTVIVEESEFGKFVDSINGLKGGTDGKYWSFYIDGELSSVGADGFTPEGGELIEWKFQAL